MTIFQMLHEFCAFLGAAMLLMFCGQILWFLLDEFITWFGCIYGRPYNKIPMYRIFGVYIETMLDDHVFPIKKDAFFRGAFARPTKNEFGEKVMSCKLVFQPWEFISGKGWTKIESSK
jgi:hypothetical protein